MCTVSLFKKWLKVSLFLLLIISMVLGSSMALADSARNPLALDMVIVIENSRRMTSKQIPDIELKKLDQDGLRFDAASALISMCDTQYSRVSYFLFNKELYSFNPDNGRLGRVDKVKAAEISLFDISLPANKPQRKKIMSGLNGEDIRNGYGTEKGTDVVNAMNAALEVQMRDSGSQNRKVILLLTAGGNKFTDEASQELARISQTAKDNDIEIYCVVLKDDTAVRPLQDLVTKAGNYQFAASPEDLVTVFRNFFTDMIGSKPIKQKPESLGAGQYEIELDIPNKSVEEVNIIIPIKQLSGLTLSDQNNKQIVKPDDDILINVNPNFASYKFIKPNPEKYYVRYNSEDDQDVEVQYVFSYSVQVNATVNAKKINKNDPVTFTAQYVENMIPTNDTLLYKIPARLMLWKGEKLLENREMEVDGDKYVLSFQSLEKYGVGEYHATIHFEGDGMLRDSEDIVFELVNNSPELKDAARKGAKFEKTINLPTQADSYDVSKNGIEWDLNDYIIDVNGDRLNAEITDNTTEADAVISGMQLKVTPRKNTATSGEVHVVVHDTDNGTSPELVFKIDIENYEDRYDEYTARFDPIKGAEKNSQIDLVLRLYDKNGNEVRGDSQLPDTVEASVTPAASSPQKVELKLQGGAWKDVFTTGPVAQDYTATATIRIGQKSITAEKEDFSSTNRPPQLTGADQDNWKIDINDPGKPDSYAQKDNSWDLSQRISDPDGDKVTFVVDKAASTSDVIASVNPQTNMLTITSKPNQNAAGDVIVHSKDNEELAGPDLVFHVNIERVEDKYKAYTAKLDYDEKGKNRNTTITLAVFDGDGILVTGDTNLPNELDATVMLNNEPTPLHMTRGEDGKWTGTFKTKNEEVQYDISASVEVGNVHIVPEELALSTVNHKPEPNPKKPISEAGLPETINIDPFLFWNQETGEAGIPDLNEYFIDPDGDKLTFSITEDTTGEYAEAVIDGNKLTITGVEEAPGTIGLKVKAVDNEGLNATSDEIQFGVKSLKKQGIIVLALIAAALIALFILYRMMKPAFHHQSFEVFTQKDNGPELPQDRSSSLKGKKPVKLSAFTTASAKQVCGTDIPTALLNSILLKPAYSNRVKVKLKGKVSAEVLAGTKKLSEKVSGTLAPGGVLSVKNNSMKIIFRLKKAGKGAPTPSVKKNSTSKPAAVSGSNSTTKKTIRSGRT